MPGPDSYLGKPRPVTFDSPGSEDKLLQISYKDTQERDDDNDEDLKKLQVRNLLQKLRGKGMPSMNSAKGLGPLPQQPNQEPEPGP